jgi:predicted transcriptional regulator of viral defense system
MIRRIKHGYYEWVSELKRDGFDNHAEVRFPDDEILISKLFPDAVVCLNSALFFYGYIDRQPAEWHLMFNRDSNKSRLRIDYPCIVPHFVMKKFHDFGISDSRSDGLKLPIYDRERIMCDVLKYANKLDRELVNQSIQRYIRDPHKDIYRLMEYGKYLRVAAKIDQWIGVWL